MRLRAKGGGDPTITVLQRELLERRKWLDEEQFALSYSLARVTPGTNVLAFCAASAWILGGWIGAMAAVFAASVPSPLLAVWLTVAFEASTQDRLAQAIVGGVQAGGHRLADRGPGCDLIRYTRFH